MQHTFIIILDNYDMQHTFLKLSLIEIEMLSWLEKEVRPKLHATDQYHGKVDTPIKQNANGFVKGNCLWNEFISGNARKLPTENDEDDIDKYVRWYDMTKAAQFDRSIIPVQLEKQMRIRVK